MPAPDPPADHAVGPPVAPKRPHRLVAHDDERVDDWYWLRDRDDPAVRAHLEAENAHTERALAHLASLRETIFDEIVSRIPQSDRTAPVPHGPYEYYRRTVEGADHEIHCRRPRRTPRPEPLPSPAGVPPDEEVLLDENVLAEGRPYFALGGLTVSPDHRLVAYLADTSGGERHELRVRDTATGTDRPDAIHDTYYGLAWLDSGSLVYVRPDAAMRPWQVLRHQLGSDPSTDVVLFEEPDERFFVDVRRSRSGAYVLVESTSKVTSEVWLVPTADPAATRVVAARRPGVEYEVEHRGDRLLVLTNDSAPDFRLCEAPLDAPDRWVERVPHRPGVRLEAVDAFDDFVVLTERADGLVRLRVVADGDASGHLVEVDDPAPTVWVGDNREPDTAVLRYGRTSLVQPAAAVDLEVVTGGETVVKVQPVGGGYDPGLYTSERRWADAPDGTRVPISLVRRRDVPLDGSAPGLLYGYGAYEHSVDPVFSPVRLSLLDRGFVYAVAHVRGGGELGRRWYEHGRLAHKRSTFTDFVACAEHLVAYGYVAPDRLVARGRSAGGLLMGAVANMRPDLFCAIVAEVPFVDVLTTMLDAELPLTVTEWEEWGNPLADAAAYRYIRSYSPYDNVDTVEYPAMLVTSGLNDARVQYWEPAKWVARLRATASSADRVLLRTELEAGHAGPSGRYDAWREEAFVLAFVLDAAGATDGEATG